MRKQPNPLFKNKDRIIKNIGVIRCYLQLDKTDFAKKAGLTSRASEFENGRYRPTMKEIERIAALAEINPSHVINHHLYLTIQIV